jgi:gas vesicle protein
MSDNRQPVGHQDENANPLTDQGAAYGARTGIGGGLVGAAIGVLLGRRVGGVVGGVVGAVAGALVGKGTAQRVNRTVESVVEAAKTAERVAEAVNQSANSVGNAIQDTVEETKSSVIGVVDAIKDTVEETKSSVVGAAKTVAEGVNHTVNDVKTVGNAVKDAVEEVKPSVIAVVDAIKDTVEEVKPSVVDAAKSLAEGVNHTVNGLGNPVKDAIEEVNPSVIAVEDVTKDTVEETQSFVIGEANSIAEDVNHTINDLGNALKVKEEDKYEEIKPSVIAREEAVKGVADESVIDVENPTQDNAEEAQPSVVSAAKSVTETVNPTGNSVGNAVKDTTEEANLSVIAVENAAKTTDEEVKPSDNHNSQVDEDWLVGLDLRRSSQEHSFSHEVKEQAHQELQDSQEYKNINQIDIIAIEYKNIQQRQEEFQRNQQETAQDLKRQRSQLRTEKIPKITGLLIGAITISLIGAVWGFTSRQNLLATKSSASNLVIKSPALGIITRTSNLEPKLSQLATKSPTSNQSLSPVPKTTPKTIADGWMFLGNINNTSSSTLSGKPLIKGSQSINSSVVPSVGSIVTVRVTPGVTLRKNKPQAPNFNAKEQKALAVIKHREKLKILKIESITPSNKTRPATPATKIWAQVDRCGSSCN